MLVVAATTPADLSENRFLPLISLTVNPCQGILTVTSHVLCTKNEVFDAITLLTELYAQIERDVIVQQFDVTSMISWLGLSQFYRFSWK